MPSEWGFNQLARLHNSHITSRKTSLHPLPNGQNEEMQGFSHTSALVRMTGQTQQYLNASHTILYTTDLALSSLHEACQLLTDGHSNVKKRKLNEYIDIVLNVWKKKQSTISVGLKFKNEVWIIKTEQSFVDYLPSEWNALDWIFQFSFPHVASFVSTIWGSNITLVSLLKRNFHLRRLSTRIVKRLRLDSSAIKEDLIVTPYHERTQVLMPDDREHFHVLISIEDKMKCISNRLQLFHRYIAVSCRTYLILPYLLERRKERLEIIQWHKLKILGANALIDLARFLPPKGTNPSSWIMRQQ